MIKRIIPFLLLLFFQIAPGQSNVLLFDELQSISEQNQNIDAGAEEITALILPGEFTAIQIALIGSQHQPEIRIQDYQKLKSHFTFEAFIELQVLVRKKKQQIGQPFPDILWPVSIDENGRFERRTENETVTERKGKSVQVLWLDVKANQTVTAGIYTIIFQIDFANGQKFERRVKFIVPHVQLSKRAKFGIDYNEYGDKYLRPYKKILNRAEQLEIEKRVFRMVHKHGGTLNVLPYKSQAGTARPGMTPVVEGSGENIQIKDWTVFDARFASYFDGTAFDDEKPLDHFYLPFNPNWPAKFEYYYDQPDRYALEWKIIAEEYMRHFKQMGWTHTVFQVYMNQKPTAKNHIPWHLDEPKGIDDYNGLRGFYDLYQKCFSGADPLKILFRIDISHFYCDKHRGSMEKDFRVNGGDKILAPVQIWVISDHSLNGATALDKAQNLLSQGRQVWQYGITPRINADRIQIFSRVYLDWYHGLTGLVIWKSLNEKLDKGTGADFMFYDGKKLGINGPLPSIRMKILRDAVQDLQLLENINDLNFLKLRNIFSRTSRLDQRREILRLLKDNR